MLLSRRVVVTFYAFCCYFRCVLLCRGRPILDKLACVVNWNLEGTNGPDGVARNQKRDETNETSEATREQTNDNTNKTTKPTKDEPRGRTDEPPTTNKTHETGKEKRRDGWIVWEALGTIRRVRASSTDQAPATPPPVQGGWFCIVSGAHQPRRCASAKGVA